MALSGYSTQYGNTIVRLSPFENANAPKNWSTWLPNRPLITEIIWDKYIKFFAVNLKTTYPYKDKIQHIL